MTMTISTLTTRAQNGTVRDDDPAASRSGAGSPPVQAGDPGGVRASLTDAGAKGALLRREGLYSSHIVEWRRARDVGALHGTRPPSTARSGSAAERRAREAAPAQRAARGPAGQAQAGPGDPGKSIGALGAAAGRERPETEQQPSRPTRDRRVLQRGRAAARHQGRLCGRRPVPGHPLPASQARAASPSASPGPAPPNKLTDAEVDDDPRACCARPASSTARRPRCTSPSSTRASIWPANRASTGSCGPTARSASGAARPPTRPR